MNNVTELKIINKIDKVSKANTNASEKNNDVIFSMLNENKKEIDISSKELTKNLIVLGETGTGKTTQVIAPILENLIKNNHAGLILDIKGNLYKYVYNFAKKNGREKDIVAFGVNKYSQPINLLKNITKEELKTKLKKTAGYVAGNHNAEFIMSGINDILSVFVLYKAYKRIRSSNYNGSLKKEDINKTTLKRIIKLVYDTEYLKDIYIYLSENKNLMTEEEEDIFNTTQENEFSLFKGIKDFNKAEAIYKEQKGWRSLQIIDTLNLIGEETKECFYNENSNYEIDFEKLIYEENKIVLVYCDKIKSYNDINNEFVEVKNKFYETILSDYKKYDRNNKYTFMVIDEYQTMINKKDFTGGLNEVSDNEFLSLSRESNHINVCCTQSVSSLLSMVEDKTKVLSIYQNFSNKICFKTSDINTLSFLFFGNIENGYYLTRAKQGEFFISYNDNNETNVITKASINNVRKYSELKTSNIYGIEINKNDFYECMGLKKPVKTEIEKNLKNIMSFNEINDFYYDIDEDFIEINKNIIKLSDIYELSDYSFSINSFLNCENKEVGEYIKNKLDMLMELKTNAAYFKIEEHSDETERAINSINDKIEKYIMIDTIKNITIRRMKLSDYEKNIKKVEDYILLSAIKSNKKSIFIIFETIKNIIDNKEEIFELIKNIENEKKKRNIKKEFNGLFNGNKKNMEIIVDKNGFNIKIKKISMSEITTKKNRNVFETAIIPLFEISNRYLINKEEAEENKKTFDIVRDTFKLDKINKNIFKFDKEKSIKNEETNKTNKTISNLIKLNKFIFNERCFENKETNLLAPNNENIFNRIRKVILSEYLNGTINKKNALCTLKALHKIIKKEIYEEIIKKEEKEEEKEEIKTSNEFIKNNTISEVIEKILSKVKDKNLLEITQYEYNQLLNRNEIDNEFKTKDKLDIYNCLCDDIEKFELVIKNEKEKSFDLIIEAKINKNFVISSTTKLVSNKDNSIEMLSINKSINIEDYFPFNIFDFDIKDLVLLISYNQLLNDINIESEELTERYNINNLYNNYLKIINIERRAKKTDHQQRYIVV